MGMLEDFLNQTISAQHSSINFLLAERRKASLRERLLYEDLENLLLKMTV